MQTLSTFRTVLLWAFLPVLGMACQKTSNPPPQTGRTDSTTSVTHQPTSADSIYVLTNLTSFDGESNQFNYDAVNHRYSSISGNAGPWDSTLFSYNPDGTLASLLEKNANAGSYEGPTVAVTVLTYNSQKQIAKIYTKKGSAQVLFDFNACASTFIGDSSAPISFVDSLVYDAKSRVSAAYRISYNVNFYWANASTQVLYYTEGIVTSLRKFYYKPDNDSLLERVENYNVDSNSNASLTDSLFYTSYDTRINPFYSVCPIDGLLSSITRYYSQAHSGLNGYSRDTYLHFSPHNCTSSSEDGNVVFNYNPAGLPVSCYYPGITMMDYTTYTYTEVKK